jgi:phosphatidylglycerophosphate synthase
MIKRHTPETQISSWRESVSIGLTALRLVHAHRMANKIRRREPIAKSMATFIAWDVADGIIARKLRGETPHRRFIDAAVDRLSVIDNVSALMATNPKVKPYATLLAVREAVVGISNLSTYLETGEVVQGKGLHKAASLSLAAFAVVAAEHEEFTDVAGTVMIGLMGITALEYVRDALGERR